MTRKAVNPNKPLMVGVEHLHYNARGAEGVVRLYGELDPHSHTKRGVRRFGYESWGVFSRAFGVANGASALLPVQRRGGEFNAVRCV